MIFSSTYAQDDLKRYSPAIARAIEYVKSTDFSQLEDGKQEIDGDKMYAKIFHVVSKPAEELHPELHKQYVDVQFWPDGEELCGFAPYVGKGTCVETREEEDLYFYQDIPNEVFLHAVKGCYAVFFPNDAHRPGVAVDGKSMEYRKVVVKVSVELL